MQAVFLDAQTFHSSISFNDIEQAVGSLKTYPLTKPLEVIERAIGAEIIITNKVMLSAALLKQLPNLKLICVSATGTNNVDLDAAKALGIVVTNVSGYASQSLSQYVLAQILNYYCRLPAHNQVTQNSTWQNSPTFCVHGDSMIELAGKTLGIYGYGTLGRAVEQLAKAFGMTVLISEHANKTAIRANRVSYQEMLTSSDIISVHCPQTKATTELFNRAAFSKMQSHCLFINTARGGVVNSVDLAKALTANEIAHAVVDVLEQEPPQADHPLLDKSLTNITITAHMAWASIEAQQRLVALLGKNIIDFQQGIATNVVK
ncbi:D-2-hydroxyacid dehydrogenase [Thalassotalea eurytherma]|uniref:Glycerate dehydrogenase n=1 Tax=Thalassotalea eurytherma TaxID=1144278 RepID=A0ABQ6H025_9GAMM|nr:D-2-hydroxyacid dehydrogenase [Thalassotalea eurytherma]GLX81538.1 glycerate dehydrogenase [Thalassotalea eurytherma]